MKPQKRPDGRWMLVKQISGVKNSFYGSSAKDCIEQAMNWNGAANSKTSTYDGMKFWIESEIIQKSKATYEQYNWITKKHIVPMIGSIKISKVLPINCQAVINKMNKELLSTTTMRHARKIMHSYFEYERVMKKSLKENPCHDLSIPKRITRRDRRAATPEELSKIFKCLSTSHYLYCFQFMLMTGLRPSETCGLKWSDLKDDEFKIREIRTKCDISDGKTDNAKRTIEISPSMKEILFVQKQFMKSKEISSDYVFPNINGFPNNSGNLGTAWKRLRTQSGVAITLYELRHTFVSLMIDKMPIKELQEFIGHSSRMDTSSTYAHALKTQRNTSKVIDNTISQFLPKPVTIVKKA